MNLKQLASRRAVPTVVDLPRALDQLVSDAAALGHEDGRRNWPPAAERRLSQAEALLHARAQRLMDVAASCYQAELGREGQAIQQADDHVRCLTGQLPEAVRAAKREFETHHTRFDTPLLEAARCAEMAARRRRDAELAAGATFRPATSGSSALLMATLVVALALEAAMSTMLIADAHPGGYFGAFGLASALAVVNLVGAFSAGRAIRALWDRDRAGWRAGAIVFTAIGVLALIAFHMVVAKLRELSLVDEFDAAMQHALVAAVSAPPMEFSSLLVGLIGLGCGLAGVVAGFKRADAVRAETEAELARSAEQALHAYETLRAEYVALEGSTARARQAIDALADRLTHARTQLATAVQTVCERERGFAQLQRQVHTTYAAALRQYRTRNASVRSDAPPWDGTDRIEPPIEHVALTTDTAILRAARATLTCTEYAGALETARLEVERSSTVAAQRVVEHLARLEGVLYRDWFTPATTVRPRLPAVSLMPVSAARREGVA